MDTPIQLNCSLRYSPDNTLIGKDVLINIRSRDVTECAQVFSDFRKQFNLSLGLLPLHGGVERAQTSQVIPQQSTPNPALPTTCQRCGAGLVRRTVGKQGSKHYGKSFFGCSNYRTGCMEVYWL